MIPKISTLIDILRWRAESEPDRPAYTFLSDDEEAERQVTYGELDRQARAIGAWLQATTSTGERVLLLYPPGLEYIAAFFGCLYAGTIAVPAYPPRRNRNLLRFQILMADAEVSAVLTTTKVLSRMSGFFEQDSQLKALRWLTSDTIPADVEATWRPPGSSTETLAFLQYTSGSTSMPKGVMVTHGNLLHNEQLIQHAFQQTAESVIVGWLPLYHDMGLIGNVIQPLFVGAPCILMSPVAFLQSPIRWLRTISRYRATTSGAPNFAYDLCVRKISNEDRATLDLSSWRVAFNGAEPVRADTMERFSEAFAPCGFRHEAFHPCYGLAEATLLVSGGTQLQPSLIRKVSKKALEQNRIAEPEVSGDDSRALVGCGRALPEERLVIVNPETMKACAPDEVGEVWVLSPSVTHGYWNRPAETAQTFHAYRADTGEGPFLRTGDLGFLNDTELFITGRLKDLIIIRGLNHYPQDIELSVERSHPALRPGCGAAFSLTVEGEERLVVVQEMGPREQSDWPSLVALIREVISEGHEIQAHAIVFIKAGTIPKTSSGKIQRRACRAMLMAGELEVVAEWHATDAPSDAAEATEVTEESLSGRPSADASETGQASGGETARVQAWLRGELAARLRLKPATIDIHRPVMHYGLDSLLAIELMHSIEAEFGVVLPFSELLDSPSITQLTAQVLAQMASANPRISVRASSLQKGATEFPLSYGQQSLWYLHEVAADNTAYNIGRALRIRSDVDVPALRRALQRLVNRHPSLRTTFVAPESQPVQIVHEHREVCFKQFDAASWSETTLHEKLVEDAYRLFNLGQEALLRAGLYTVAPKEHVLLLTMHHIISDFWSLVQLMDELGAFYEAEHNGSILNLPPLTHSYADYVSWQKEMLQSPEGERQWNYWREHLEGELPVLNLPTDKARPLLQTHRGASYLFRLDRELVSQLKALSHDCGATLYMTLLAAFQVLLARYSGQPEFIIGTPTSGRTRAEFSNVLGYFVNPISLRANLTEMLTFAGLLQQVKRVALQAFKHQDYPFTLLVKRIQPERDTSRSPLFQTMFVWQKAHLDDAQGLTELALEDDTVQINFGGLQAASFALRRRVVQFDLTLMMAEMSEGIGASLEYMEDLFEETTIARMASHFQNILRHVVSAPHQLVSAIPLLSAAELHQLLDAPNDTSAPYPQQTCLHELFEAQVRRTPDNPALTFDDQTLTYRELNARANQLAHHLRREGAGPEQLVAILMERSSEMVMALLAVLKAGAAYLPLDPNYPAQRLSYMLSDSGARLVLTQEELSRRVPGQGAQVIIMGGEWSESGEQDEENPLPTATPDNLAYVIYTSGSTGLPKGVAIMHRSLCNYTQFICELLKLDELQKGEGVSFATVSTLTADLGNTTIFPSLISGGQLHVLGYDVATDSDRLASYFARHRIDVLKIVPSHLNALLLSGQGAKILPAKYLILGGEAFSFELLERIRETGSSCVVINHYGPTETTVGALTFNLKQSGDIRKFSATVPIGRPVANTKIYIVDRNMRPVPAGVAGELCIGGIGVMRGYLNRPALTAARLSPNPFGDDPQERLYHTGDLVRYLPDGNVEFLGRIDQQIKIRGFRIEPGEIEAALLRHESVREAVIMAREDVPGEKHLVAYVVMSEGCEPQCVELRPFLQSELPDYMVPSAIVSLRALPLTPNGKLDRRALPAPDHSLTEAESSYVAPRNEAERQLAAIWRELLRVERVGIHDNFFALGGDSILSIQIVSKAHQVGLRLSSKQLFQYHTIAELAEAANSVQSGVDEERVLAGSVPLTPIQHRFFQQDFAEPHHWNQSVLLETHRTVDASILEKALAYLHLEHASLRLRFTRGEEGWQQFVVAPGEPPPFKKYDLSHQPREAQQRQIEETAQELQASLNLSEGPISRAVYFKLGSAEAGRLLLIIHHLAVDAVSWRIIVEDLTTVYHQLADGLEAKLPFRTASFKRWAEHLTAYSQSSLVRGEAGYWLREVRRRVARLPLDKAGSSNTVSGAKTLTMSLTAEETQSLLQEVPQAFQTHLDDVLLAALGQTLSQWTHAREILIDMEGHGREALFDDADVSGTVGWFTSVYPVVLQMPGRDAEPWEILRSVKEQLRAVPKRGIGYGLLRYASADRDIGRKLRALPQAEIVFNYLGQLDHVLPTDSFFKQAHESSGQTRSLRGHRPYLLEIIGHVRMGCLRMDWTYSENAHHRETVERLVNDFSETLRLFIECRRSPQAARPAPYDFPLAQLSDEQLSEVFQEVSFED